MSLDGRNLRYIVLMLDSNSPKYSEKRELLDTHDGEIYCNLEQAKAHAAWILKSGFCSQFAIGVFVIDANSEKMGISMIETYGFKGDKKDVGQMSLFA
jgi:hypothetical protein